MKFPHIEKSIKIDGKKLSFEVGRLAFQANAAVLAKKGDTVILATVTSSLSRAAID